MMLVALTLLLMAAPVVAQEAPMKFTPRVLNRQSKGKWLKGHLFLPEGFTVEDVDCNSPASLEPMGVPSEYINAFIRMCKI